MAMKTIRSNWRIEVQPVSTTTPSFTPSDDLIEEVCNGVAQMIGDQCPEIPAHCIEVKCDEKRICDICGKPRV